MLIETSTAPADHTASPDTIVAEPAAPAETAAPADGQSSAAAIEPTPLATSEAEPEVAAAPTEFEEAAEPAESNSDEPIGGDGEELEPAVIEPPRTVFADLGLSEPLLQAIAEMGYIHPTPIQEQAIPFVLMGRDVLGVAQTGTGKTASFTLPLMDILAGSRARARMPRSLILEPTRELALQVSENFQQYGKHLKLTHALLIGGESMSEQKDVLNKGVDVLIATPGRLIDLFERGGLLMTDARILVIDEADRMLDMGFIPDVERIVAMLPANRQTLFFSATMAPEIKRLADAFLQNPKVVTVSRPASVATTIVAGLVLVAELDKREALRRLIRSEQVQNALIFCNRKTEVDILYKSLKRHEFSVGALHGDLSQAERTATMAKFKAGELRLMVCSDVAARGVDISGLSHVFNFDVPHHAEDYVHRIGRTGRAGLIGHAFTLATPDDRLAVEAIEHLVGAPIPRLSVDGLDPVEWAEGDGRKRRGRGRTPAKPEPKPRRAPEPDRPRKAAAKVAVANEPVEPEILAADPEKPRPPRRSRAARPEAQSPAAERAAPPPDARPREPVTARESARPRREGRYRDDDLGPSVRGFGDDVPAFMLIRSPKRAPKSAHDRASERRIGEEAIA